VAISVFLAAPALALAAPLGAAHAATTSTAAGAVFTQTNDAARNAVMAWSRATDGSLTLEGSFPTGGRGSGAGLGVQGAVAISGNRRWLFAVNAGSDTVSSFRILSTGLAQAGLVRSHGDEPASLTISGSLLYVLNAGGDGNISGFRVNPDGTLAHLRGSTRPLSQAGGSAPAEIAFSKNGRLLEVTEKATNSIDSYVVGANGNAHGPIVHPSSGATPFGFAFGPRGSLIVSEAQGGAPGASTVSSYDATLQGGLVPVSASVPDHNGSACWIAVTPNGRYAYAANTGSGTVSGYSIGSNNSLSLLDHDGVTGVTGSHPADEAISSDGAYLYVLNGADGTFSAFAVNSDGSLSSMAGASGIPLTASGVAAL
jgi:6-phosphogluconolactonase (cycloisomerase 2 family)